MPGSTPSRVEVIGGGPGGAFAARLIRLALPTSEITLLDPLPPEDTFGFGVGLSVSTQKNLGRSDPETFRQIAEASHSGQGGRMYSGRTYERIPGNDQVAIARSRLLQILYKQAERAGVTISVGERVDAFDRDADLVIAADGVGSGTRLAAASAFGARETTGRQKFIWCGADAALPDALFAPVESEFGTLTTHAYPYAADRSTFLVETDEHVWRAAGFDRPLPDLAPGESDEEARAFLECTFKDHLGGAQLLGNNSRWTQFRTVHCNRWWSGNVALLGDAAHTAHYSVGSGTKLAMEDAIALAAALVAHADLGTALTAYQQARRRSVEQLQYLARRSELWWESFVDRFRLTPAQMVVSFFSRAGNVSFEALREREPALVERAMAAYGTGPADTGDPTTWAIGQPLMHRGRRLHSRNRAELDVELLTLTCEIEDPRSPAAAAFVETVTAAMSDPTLDGVELDGPADASSVRHRLDVAEQVTLRTGALVSVTVPSDAGIDVAAALVAGRTDLVTLT